MRLLSLLPAPARAALVPQLGLLLLAVLALAAIFPLANYGVLRSPQPVLFVALGMLGLALLVASYLLKRRAARVITQVLESELRALRVELSERLAASPLRTIEAAGLAQTGLVSELSDLDEAAQNVVETLHYLVLLVFLGGYVLWLSPGGFVLWVVICFGLGALLMPEVETRQLAVQAHGRARAALHRELDRALRAYPQLQLDPQLRRGVLEDLGDRLAEAAALQVDKIKGDTATTVCGSTLLYLGVAAMLFSAPSTLGLDVTVTYELVTVLFLTIIPVNKLLEQGRSYLSAEVALARLSELRDSLAAPDVGPPEAPQATFESLAF